LTVSYDVAVVGGGHNGLVCAAFLAQAGKRVIVLEARDIVGGFCTTEETVPEAPGFKMNRPRWTTSSPTSPIGGRRPRAVPLRAAVDHPRPVLQLPPADGPAISFWRDHHRTVEEIRRLSRRDALRYDRFVTCMKDFWYTAAPYLQGHPKRVAPGTILELTKRLAKTRKSMGTALRILMSSPGAVIEEWFTREEVKAALGCYSVASMGTLDEPGSGIVLSVMAVMHHWGARRPVGGNGAFTQALAAAATAAGVEIRTGAPVAEILLGGDRATGVVTLTGETIRAGEIVAAIDPTPC